MFMRKESDVSNKRAAVVIIGAVVGVAAYYFFAKTLFFFLVGWLFFIPMVGIVYTVYGLQEYRTITRNVSINKQYVEKLKPSIEKHNGNFSAAVRDVISQAALPSFRNSVSIDNFLFKWMVDEIEDRLLPDNVLDEIIDPRLIDSMENLESFLNNKFIELEWDVGIVLKYDSNTSPSDILMEINGSPQKIKFVASLISQFLVKNSLKMPINIPLKISSTVHSDRCVRVEFSRSNKKEALDSLVSFFGSENEIIKTIKSKPAFWKAVINTHVLNNYSMVTVPRNYFEELFDDKVPTGQTIIENRAMKPINEIPLEEVFSLIKEVYETSRIVDRVEIDKKNLILFHTYRNKNAIEKLKTSLINLLDANGHLYDAKSTANMIFLTYRQNKIDVMKKSSNRFDSGTSANFC